jgi:chemotaxis protein CheD
MGDEAMELFMTSSETYTVPAHYRVYVWGGNMFSEPAPTGMDIGQQNIDMAQRMLDQYGFAMACEHLGSFGRRKVAFDVWTGEVDLIHIDHRKQAAHE